MRRLDRVSMPLFDGLDAEALEEVYWRLRPRHFAAGRVVWRAGEPGDRLLVIRQGLVYVLAGDAEASVVARLRPGDVVGEMALLTDEPHPATLVAQLPTDAFELPREAFLSLAARFPALMANLARILSRRLSGQTALRERRPSASALVAGGWALAHVGELFAAAAAASPRLVDGIDLTLARQNAQVTNEALARLEAALRAGRSVVVAVGPDHRNLPLLLDHMDRLVAIMDADEARGFLHGHDTLAPRLELVELGSGGQSGGESGLGRVVRRWVGEPRPPELAWLGRHLAGTKLGLALGAGGAKGYAHVGVIRALQAAGYTIDYVAGSSIGAWVGAWLARGMDADEIERTLRTQFTPDVVEAVFRRGATGEPSGLEVMARVAQQTLGDCCIEELGTPLVVMATDLEGRRSTPMTSGRLDEVLVAAMAVPGLYSPIPNADQRLVDAVVTTPVPSEAVIAAGAEVSVAVNLLGREMLAAWPDQDPAELGAAPAGRARDTLVESLEVAQIGAAARQAALADVPITPRFGPGTWRHFHLADRYLAAGAQAAEAALPLLATLARPALSAR